MASHPSAEPPVTEFAVIKLTPSVEAKIADLIKKAAG